MIGQKISSFVYYLMMAVLIANITQRKHVKHGEKKRLATLWTAGILLFFQIELVLIQHYKLSDYFIIPAIVALFVVVYFLRNKINVFKTKCVSCGAKLNYKRILYWDSNKCEICDPPEEPAEPLKSPEETKSAALNFKNARTVEEVDWDVWEPTETAVICYIFKDDKVLLIHKKTGLGKGKINAPGGRIEAGEMPMDAAVRETEEETGLTPLNLKQMGVLSFIFTDGYSLKGFVYFADDYTGDLMETDEADPFWQPVDKIPYDEMWEDDIHWLPKAIDGKFINGKFIFDKDTMLGKAIDEG